MAFYSGQEYEPYRPDLQDPSEDEDDFDLAALESGTDINAKRDENYEKRFQDARSSIKSRGRFVDDNVVEQFLYEFRDIAGKCSANVNLLHELVEVVKHTEEPEHVELLVRRLVELHPHLLKYPNHDEQNPVLVAIRSKQHQVHQLVDYMIATCVKNKDKPVYSECLDDALRKSTDREGRTCLHVALQQNLNPEMIRLLIENASDEALAVQDNVKKTPMHYAVSFSQCTYVRVDLINVFIERDLDAIQSKPRPATTFLDLSDSSGRSIYQEHQKTRRSGTKAYKEWLAKYQQRQEAENRKRGDRGDATERPRGGESRTRTSMVDRHRLSATQPGDRGSGRDEKEPEELDERELLRRQKKVEEEAARLGEAEAATKTDQTRARYRDRDRERDRDWERDRGRERNRDMEPDIDRPRLRGHRGRYLDGDGERDNSGTLTGGSAQQTEPTPNNSMKRSNTTRLESKRAQDKEKLPKRPAATTRRSGNAKSMTALTYNSDEILMKLKLHYMRTRNVEMTIFFLYGSNMNDIQISFDYDSLPRKMLWNEFIKRFGADSKTGLKFDPVLQYVTFPHVDVRLKGRLADLQRDAELQYGISQLGALGRKDMKYFFEWLYKKGVRHIIRLSVEDPGDSGEKVHSDQAIQESLENFVVEHLDWQKTDLDPETILHVSSKASEKESPTPMDPKNVELVPNRQLQQLYLRWSGSNVALRAWSELEGLPMLPKLQRIYLMKPPFDKTYDNQQWIAAKIENFRDRLNASRRTLRSLQPTTQVGQGVSAIDSDFGDVQVVVVASTTGKESKGTSGNTTHFSTSPQVKGVNSHRWLDSTAKFASGMIPFWQNIVSDFRESKQIQSTPDGVEADVVIALIDDGVDMFDNSLSNRVFEGKSFDFHDGKVRPPFSSAKGHGTVMASMILRICPMAKVYPIRLKTYDNANGKNNIDADYAAHAIQAALDKNATIISMSWTLPMAKGKTSSESLHKVVKKAVDSKVLMFCSAPDEGKFSELDYPSGPWRNHFFRIGAARADGTVFPWTPDDGITYVLPGVDVIREQVGNSTFETPSAKGVTSRVVDFKFETGSSVAIALAAGLAAMIIYCVKASILAIKTANHNKGQVMGVAIPDNGANLIADPDAMKRAFATLGTVTPNNFIQVWEGLDEVSKVLEIAQAQSSNPEAKLKCIERFMEFGLKLANSAKP